MIAVRTKITFLILALCLIILVILITLLFNFLGPAAFLTLISVIPFAFLIDKVRESLSERLNYLNDNFISGIYCSLKFYDGNYLNSYFSESVGEIREKQADLKKYSHFMCISVLPKKLLEKMDSFILIREPLFEKINFVLDSVKKIINSQGVVSTSDFGKYPILKYLGFKIETNIADTSSIVFKATKQFEKDNPQIVTEINGIIEEITKSKNEILLELEDFFKSNNFRIPDNSTSPTLALSLVGLD